MFVGFTLDPYRDRFHAIPPNSYISNSITRIISKFNKSGGRDRGRNERDSRHDHLINLRKGVLG